MNPSMVFKRLPQALALAGLLLSALNGHAATFTYRVPILGLKGPAALTFSSSAFNFGSVDVGQTASGSFTLSNTGGYSATGLQLLASANFSVSSNCGSVLSPGASCSGTVVFTPTSGISYSGTLSASNASGSAIASLTGIGLQPADTVSVGSLAFGYQTVGTTSSSLGVQLTNTGNVALPISQITASGNFSASQNCGSSLAIGANCAVNVSFTPASVGSNTGTLSIATAAGTQSVSLSGTGQGATLAASPASLAFGALMAGTGAATQTVTLTNTGNIAAGSLAFTLPTGYTQTNTCGTALAVGANCTLSVTFAPSAQQPYNGTIQVATGTTTQSIPVTGAGGAASWGVSTSTLTLPTTQPGTSSTASLVITNNGTVAATPTVAASSYFTATGCGSVAPGANCTSTVTFSPTYGQLYSGTLTVAGGNSATQSVTLSGDGRVSAVPNGTFAAPSNVIFSPDHTYWLAMQTDCNLVEYHNGTGVWSTNTSNGATNCTLDIQNDGNVVVYKGALVSANAVWNSNTAGHGYVSTYLQLGNDGIIHLYQGTIGNPVAQYWAN
jgi:hypothetical protein